MTNSAISSNAEALKLDVRVWQLVKEKNIKQALASCQDLNRQFPDFAQGWHSASQLALNINRPDVALGAIERAVQLDPDSIDWMLQKGLCFGHLNRTAELGELLKYLQSREIKNVRQNSIMGLLLTQMEMREEAIGYYRNSAEIEPGQSQHFYNIAVLQRALGQLDEAEKHLDKAIRLNPADYEAYKVRAELRTQTSERNHVKAMEKLLKRGISDPRGKVNVCFGLAKELEDLDESERSFHYLKIGADTRRSYMQYDPQTDLQTMSVIADTYAEDVFNKQIEGHSSEEPIFIIGMPRTGTTLVERILASHSEVYAAGELSNFTAKLMDQAKVLAGFQKVSKQKLVQLTTSMDFRKLGREYIESTRPLTGHTKRFIDKLPLNYLYAGLIHLALPQAKIINLKRHPVDTCYAIYKQLFIDGYPFSYNLEELGHYFLAYHQLMEHWNRVMPGVIHTVNYEELVKDVEGESRCLLNYCGLAWQEGCLRFYENSQASSTASAAQVRQPVYQSSVAKWTRYEEQLAPLIRLLREAEIPLD